MIHEWWAVELRKLARSIDTLGLSSRDAMDALDRVLELIEEGPEIDCDECFDRWMDEGAADVPEGEGDGFPQRLGEDHVIRILALEDAVLVRHGLEQWLVALRARRRRAGAEVARRGDPTLAAELGARVLADGVQELREEDRQVRSADPG